jgi:hypothetical protein
VRGISFLSFSSISFHFEVSSVSFVQEKVSLAKPSKFEFPLEVGRTKGRG